MRAFRYLYGPVPSRRLGRSLGIDLVPHKVCTYNCIYCQIGKTTNKTLQRKEYIPVEEVLEEVKHFLKEETVPIDHVSLSGSGEPTLHSKIGLIIKEIKRITSVSVAVITNGSLLSLEEVRKDLLEADVILPSLDAVFSETFLRVNRPLEGFSIEEVIEGLEKLRRIYKGKIWLEILFCKGINDSQEELYKMREVIARIKPDQIHLNTVIRPPSEEWAVPLDQKEMEKIREFFGEDAIILSEDYRRLSSIGKENIKEEILRILKRRPLSLADLSKGIGVREDELGHYIDSLLKEKRIRVRHFGNMVFYEFSKKETDPL
ncbi:MAG: radical SAM protein [Thermodesulfobacteriota bacterium]